MNEALPWNPTYQKERQHKHVHWKLLNAATGINISYIVSPRLNIRKRLPRTLNLLDLVQHIKVSFWVKWFRETMWVRPKFWKPTETAKVKKWIILYISIFYVDLLNMLNKELLNIPMNKRKARWLKILCICKQIHLYSIKHLNICLDISVILSLLLVILPTHPFSYICKLRWAIHWTLDTIKVTLDTIPRIYICSNYEQCFTEAQITIPTVLKMLWN